MTNLRKKLTIIAGLFAGASATMGALVACSSSDTVVKGEAGTDGGGTDAPTTDSPSGEGGQDAGKDVVQVEAGTLAEFLKLNAEATCTRFKECCTAGSSKTFDIAKCQSDYNGAGWNQSLSDILGADGGAADQTKLNYDPAKGSECLTAIRNMTCKDTPAGEFKNAWSTCFAAVTGKVGNGQACKSSAECTTSGFCDLSDGGVCTPFKASGAACEPHLPDVSEECSYRGVGASQCQDTGGGALKCTTTSANGSGCDFDPQCSSGACTFPDAAAPRGTCDSKTDFFSGVCDQYLK